jgi:hypothetical protein
MISEKGIFFASDYWSGNVYQQASNSMKDRDGDGKNDGDPYGLKGEERWQIIALSEGWANYREWKLASQYLGYNFSDQTLISFLKNNGFPRCYGALFVELKQLGCSYSNMEKSLATYNFSGYRDNLTAIYPSLRDSITAKVNRYENANY